VQYQKQWSTLNIMIITKFFIICGIISSCLLLPAEAQLPFSPLAPTLPTVKAWMPERSFTTDLDGKITFHIAVEVPPDHHAYLDKGDEGLLIPLSFTFPALEERSVRVELISSPTGTRDEKVSATLLRGTHDFVFHLHGPADPAVLNSPVSARLRYQICNDVTNICYPPQEKEVALHFVNRPGDSLDTSTASLSSSLTLGERVTALFQRYTQHFLLVVGLVFIAGLLATATPCVYPVLPITAAVLMARAGSSPQHIRVHALLYPELSGVGGQPFLPLFAIYSSQGKLLWKGQNYQAVNTMVTQLERAKRIIMQ
jgi:hypothetical protein